MSSSPSSRSPNKLLPPLPAFPKSTHYNALRQSHLQTCVDWRKKYALTVKLPEWKPILKPIAKPLSNFKESRLEKLVHERNRLLMQTDRLASDISRDVGWKPAVEMCEWCRQTLATSAEEAGDMLRLWIEPTMESLQYRIRKLMDIRCILALLILIQDLCSKPCQSKQDSGESGIGGDERENFDAFDWEVPRKQISNLIDRLAWCPPMHRHFDEVVGKNSQFSVLRMATQDAERVKKWLKEVREGTAGYFGKGKGPEIEVANVHPGKATYMKAWIIAVVAEIVNLPLVATAAQAFVDMIEENELCGIKDVIEEATVKNEAIAGLKKHIAMEYKYSDFWPDLPEEFVDAEPVKFDQGYVGQVASELGYGNLHEGMDPCELAMLL